MASLESVFAGKAGIKGIRSSVTNLFSKNALRNLEVQRSELLYPPSIYEVFREPPLFVDQDGDGPPTGSGADTNLMLSNETTWHYIIKGTQTIVKPVWDSTVVGGGLNIGMDQTDGDGVEFVTGLTARAPFVLKAGTSGGYIEVDLTVADVSGAAEMAVGFKKPAAASVANLDDNTDLACLNMQGGDVKIETILNSGATTTTDTTVNMTDGQQIRLRIEVSSAGAVTYAVGTGAASIDGPTASTPATTAAFTFDSGDYLVPFIFFLHGAEVAGDVKIQKIECGYL